MGFYFCIMIGIYKITSPTKRIYIGQSINIEKRFKSYEKLNCKSSDRSGKLSDSTIKKMCLGRINVAPKSKEVRKKHSDSLKMNYENSKRLLSFNEKRKIKIGVFDFNSEELISEFNSIRECACGYKFKYI